MRKSGQFEFVFKDPETVETISMRSPIERPPLPHPQSSRIHDFVRRDLLFDGVLKIGCIWPKPVVFGQNGCVWAKWLVRSLVSQEPKSHLFQSPGVGISVVRKNETSPLATSYAVDSAKRFWYFF